PSLRPGQSRTERHRMPIPSGLPPRMREIASGATRKTPIVTTGTENKGHSPGNNRGTRPATPVSPDYPAKDNNRQAETRPVAILAKFGSAATNEVTRRDADPVEFDEFENEASRAAAEIAMVYRRKLAGLRYLSRNERPHAL